MVSRLRKAELKELLANRDNEELLRWASSVRNPLRVLISLTYDEDELARWRAIEAVGLVAVLQRTSDLEKIRDIIRRMMWLMNDESGGLGWHSPEMVGEILVNVPELIPEYAGLLPAYFHEEPFERGTWSAVSRVAAINSEIFREFTEEIETALTDPDPYIRCYVALILEKVCGLKCREAVIRLVGDHQTLALYDFQTGQLRGVTVEQIAIEIRDRLDASEKAA